MHDIDTCMPRRAVGEQATTTTTKHGNAIMKLPTIFLVKAWYTKLINASRKEFDNRSWPHTSPKWFTLALEPLTFGTTLLYTQGISEGHVLFLHLLSTCISQANHIEYVNDSVEGRSKGTCYISNKTSKWFDACFPSTVFLVDSNDVFEHALKMYSLALAYPTILQMPAK